MVGMPRRSTARPAVTEVAPLRSASCPLISSPRVGVHMGAQWKSVKRTLSLCSLSMFGVRSTGLPWQEKSP